jgi:hypothetical protein
MATSISRVLCIRTDGLTASDTFTANRAFKVIDVHGVVTTQAATTTTVQRGSPLFAACSSALTDNAVVGTLARTASIAPAEDDFVTGNVLRALSSGAGRQRVFTQIIPIPA